jgi:hypothetical protein
MADLAFPVRASIVTTVAVSAQYKFSREQFSSQLSIKGVEDSGV